MKKYAIAPGDPAGIGYEITVKSLSDIQIKDDTIFIIYASAELIYRACSLFAPSLSIQQIDTPDKATDPKSIYLIDAGVDIKYFEPGKIDSDCAKCAHQSLMKIVQDVKSGYIQGICTGPIHKGAMRLAGIDDIGHTEMLANGFNVQNPLTLFITNNLRIFFYTRHLSLRDAIDALNVEKITQFAVMMNHHIHQLGFEHPKLAMAALNPHASDGGQFGHEEADILIPAVESIQKLGIDMKGPIGADSVFAQAAKGMFDAVLSLYHDQGHIAAKTYDFEKTISCTLGLPCLRTSVDHGTAMDIAWQGKAQHVSMITALEILIKYSYCARRG